MKSIRLSMIVYFLALAGAALGTVSVIVYRMTQQTLQAEEQARREMLEERYKDLRQQEIDKLNTLLADQVRNLANQTIIRSRYLQWFRPCQAAATLGAVTAHLAPNGHLGSHLWMGMAYGRTMYPNRLIPLDIQPSPELQQHAINHNHYFQIKTTTKTVLSDTLEDRALPFDPRQYASGPSYTPIFDEFDLEPGERIRRATFKVPSSQFGAGAFPTRGGTRPGGGRAPTTPARAEDGPTSPTPSERAAEPRMTYHFQYAVGTNDRDQTLADLNDRLDKDLEQHARDSAATLTSLRNRLLLLSVITFGLIALGSFTLVRIGLTPLQRLSEAVSRISEKDMRLQLDQRRVPQELRPIVERLDQTLGQLERAFAREKQAAADISHELRTPLAAMLTTAEVALRKPRSPEEYREVLQDCRASCQQMSRLVERLLALSRLDAGVDRLRPQEVDAGDVVEQCAGMVRPLAEARGLTLAVQRNGPARIAVDADKLREILTNLLHNAIEYNHPKGRVDVAIERENGTLSVEVRDTGIGITPEAQKHIFERFYRADAARNADGMHAGLGLAIVKGYVDLMGGSITVQSAQGQGSTFRLQLPARPNAATGA